MTLEEIKDKIDDFLKGIAKEKYNLMLLDKPPKNIQGELMIKIMSKLKTIVANPINNPIMKYDEAQKYYFYSNDSLKNIQDKYITIIELQDYIISQTEITFIYDRFIISKILQITQDTFNQFIEDCRSGVNSYDEDIANIFVDIETMLISDRNASAENFTRNSKAIDTTNRYETKYGGYGITSVSNKNTNNAQTIINITPEEAEKKLHTFGLSQIDLNNNDDKK